MKKLLVISLILCLATSVLGQFKPMMGTQVNIAHPLSDFVAFWPMWEGSGNKVFDLSGNGNTGTLVADTHFVPGKFGSALDFDGTDDYVLVADNPTLDIIGGITIVVFFKIDTIQQSGIVSRPYDTSTANWYKGNYRLSLYGPGEGADEGKIEWLTGDGTNLSLLLSTTVLSIDTDYCLVATRTAAGVGKIYLNGVEDNSGAMANGPVDGSQPLYFGISGFDQAVLQDPLDGQISHAGIYNRVFSSPEVALLYREPFCMFEEGLSVKQMYSYAAPPAVPVPVFYYHYVNHALLVLPIIPFGLYCYLRRRKCAA